MLATSVEGFLVSGVSCYVCTVSVVRVVLRELRGSCSPSVVLCRKCGGYCGVSVQIIWKAVVL